MARIARRPGEVDDVFPDKKLLEYVWKEALTSGALLSTGPFGYGIHYSLSGVASSVEAA